MPACSTRRSDKCAAAACACRCGKQIIAARELGAAARSGDLQHVIELEDTAVKIAHGGFGLRDPLLKRRRVSVASLIGRNLVIEMRAAEKAERANRSARQRRLSASVQYQFPSVLTGSRFQFLSTFECS
jgi:hypothetical protein